MVKQKILIVDDEEDVLEILKDNLELMNFDVITASNGKEAIIKARENMPDLILLDIMMPEMDGHSTARRIKSNVITKHIPIIMITAKGEMEDIVRAGESGVADYILKPYDPMVLKEKINRVLHQ